MASDKSVQRTITSFFQKNDGQVGGKLKKASDVKPTDEVQSIKRKRRVISSSDEEDGKVSPSKTDESKQQTAIKKIKEEKPKVVSPQRTKDLSLVMKTEPNEAVTSHELEKAEHKQPVAHEKSNAVAVHTPIIIDEKSYYFPNKSDYHPIKDAPWQKGADVPYLALAYTLAQIEETSSRLKMIEILSNFFRSVILLSPNDLLCSIYLCLNQLAPAYVGVELGVGESLVMKALAQATGRSLDKVKADVTKKGDIGLVAEASKATQKTLFKTKDAGLTVKGVFKRLTEVAVMTGNASQTRKVDKIQSLLVVSKQLEARFLVRSLVGKLRIGLAEQSLLQALALAGTATPPNKDNNMDYVNCLKGLDPEKAKAKVDANALILKTAYCECPSYDRIVPVFLREGIESLASHCSLTPGVPLKPMLACPTRGVSEVLQRFEGSKFTCEWKYDGERAQIHLLEDGDIRIYSRNQENNTSKYPDIVSRFRSWINTSTDVKSAILDSEAVAWDPEKKQILPFQVLSTRKRKDATEAEIKVQVLVFAFDLLYLNGEPLIRLPLAKRREKLKESFHQVEGQFEFATSKDPSSVEEVEEFLEESIRGNCEGLMVKGLEEDATYEIAKRSKNWLKLKKDYIDGVGDTIDVVVIGGYLGKGKRTGVYGGFLLACYDESNEEYQSLCKIGTGFTEEDFLQHSEFLKQKVISQPKPYYRFDPSLAPDHWFEPCQVWEIKCADLSLSPVHRAAVGIADPVKGISLRFPRFIRIRDDKNPEDATSAEQIAELYANQDQVKNQLKENDEEGFY